MPDLDDFFVFKNTSQSSDEGRGGGCFPVVLVVVIVLWMLQGFFR